MTAADESPAHRAALTLLRSKQALSAERLLEALVSTSEDARAWHYLGIARHLLRKLPAAAIALRRSLDLDPAHPGATCVLTAVLTEQGRYAEAEEALRKSVALYPSHPDVHYNLAVILEQRGAEAEALQHYDAALGSSPDHPQALLNRGALYLRHAQHENALRDFDRIISRDPGAVDALLNRTRTLLHMHRDDEALSAARAVRRLAPTRPEGAMAAAFALASMGYMREAARALNEANANWFPAAVFAGRAGERQDLCDWQDRDRLVALLRELLRDGALEPGFEPGLAAHVLRMPFTEAEIRTAARLIASAVKPLPTTVPLARPRNQRIRVGIFSAGVGRHPETYLLRRAVGEMDRSRFEVRLYALNPDDGTHLRRNFAALADSFADLSALDSSVIVDQARNEGLDIALDTTGYFKPGRPELFKTRMAPVQAAYISSPWTAGPGVLDYRISDPWITPAHTQPMWEEKLVLLPPPHFVFDNSIEPGAAGLRADHGLPDNAFVYCCINQAWKIEPDVFSTWMAVMRAVTGSVLWLIDAGPANANLRAAAARAGVDPERLVFAPRVPLEQHMGRLRHADVFLDTFYYNAHTTALDALWSGLPVLTRQGGTMASRIAAAFLRSAGLTELVCETSEEYEAIALRLARDPEALERVRAKLAVARGIAPVFDTVARVRALERALIATVGRDRAGLPPDTLVIE